MFYKRIVKPEILINSDAYILPFNSDIKVYASSIKMGKTDMFIDKTSYLILVSGCVFH
jgi:hypothetical protein